jgi:hypothetical protein
MTALTAGVLMGPPSPDVVPLLEPELIPLLELELEPPPPDPLPDAPPLLEPELGPLLDPEAAPPLPDPLPDVAPLLEPELGPPLDPEPVPLLPPDPLPDAAPLLAPELVPPLEPSPQAGRRGTARSAQVPRRRGRTFMESGPSAKLMPAPIMVEMLVKREESAVLVVRCVRGASSKDAIRRPLPATRSYGFPGWR